MLCNQLQGQFSSVDDCADGHRVRDEFAGLPQFRGVERMLLNLITHRIRIHHI